MVESDARLASVARFYGWKLRSFEKPEKEPVYYPAEDAWFLLDGNGGRSLAPPNFEVIEDVPF